jgi:hypothetical protein
MRSSRAHDRLLAGLVSQIDWKNGNAPLRGIAGPMVVRDVSPNDNADAWVEASEEGFCLHFNAKDRYGEWRGHSEPVSNVARII